MVDFRNQVRLYCREKNIKMCDVAKSLGIGEIGFSANLKKNNPRLDTMEKIASVLEISLVELLSYTPESKGKLDTGETIRCPHCGGEIGLFVRAKK